MKKTLLIFAAALAFVACSNDETVRQAAPEAIGFDNAFVENSTRSEYDPSYSNDTLFDSFQVYGWVEDAVLFDNVEVSKNINNAQLTSDWKYNGIQYWIADAKYNFSAIAGAGYSDVTAAKDQTTLSFTNTGEDDLLYAQSGEIIGKASGNATVGFNFKHLLSKVKFSFTNDYNATNSTIRVRNIAITNAYTTGDVALSLDADKNVVAVWSNWDANTLGLNFGNAALASATAEEAIAQSATVESYNEMLLIPANTTYTVKFTVDILIGGTYIKSFDHSVELTLNNEFGKSYDVAATINAANIDPAHAQEPIEFSASVIDWVEPTDANGGNVNM